jgi:hypothetical protein
MNFFQWLDNAIYFYEAFFSVAPPHEQYTQKGEYK